MVRLLKRFCRHERGVALIEFALVLPLLALLFFGGLELTRYIQIAQKVEKTGYTMGDILTQETPSGTPPTLPAHKVRNVIDQLKFMMTPYSDDTQECAIISSVTKHPDDHTIHVDWQWRGGGGCFSGRIRQETTVVMNNHTSDIERGMMPSNPLAQGLISNSLINQQLANGCSPTATGSTCPGGMLDKENMIVTEVFFHYQPYLFQILRRFGLKIRDTVIIRRTFMHPRNGDINLLSKEAA